MYGSTQLFADQDSWWDAAYRNRREITFGNDHDALPQNFTLSFNMDTRTANTNVKKTNGDDIRILRQTDIANTELDRIADVFNDANSLISFRLQANIIANALRDANAKYYVYYNNNVAGAAPANEMNVYYFADFFNRADSTTVGNGWTEWTNSGNMSLSGNILQSAGNNGGPPGAGVKQDFTLGAITSDFEVSWNWNLAVNTEATWTHMIQIGDAMPDNNRVTNVAFGLYAGEGAHFTNDNTENINANLAGVNLETNINGAQSMRLVVNYAADTFDYWRGGVQRSAGVAFLNGATNLTQIRMANDQYSNTAPSFTYDNLIVKLRVANDAETAPGSEEQIIALSGTVYAANESTALTGASRTVNVKVNGAGAYSLETVGGTGAFSFSALIVNPGDSIAVYLENETEKANTITITDALTDISSLPLMDNHVVLRSDNGATAVTILDLLDYDNDQNAADMLFDAEDAAPDTFILEAGVELFIHGGDAFTPGGDVTLLAGALTALDLNGIWNATGAETLTLRGSLDCTGGTFNRAGELVILQDMSGGNDTINITSAGNTFNDMQILGSQSADIFQLADALNIAGDLTLSTGVLSLNGKDITVSGVFSNDAIFRLQGGETSVTLVNDTDSGTVEYVGGGSYATLKAGHSYFNLVFNGSGSWQQSAALDIDGDLTLSQGTLDSNDQNLELAGVWTNNAAYDGGDNTVTCNGATTPVSIAGSSTTTFNHLVINKSDNSKIVNVGIALNLVKTLTLTTGQLNINAQSTTVGDIPNTISAGAMLKINGGQLDLTAAGNGLALSLSGTLDLDAGAFHITGAGRDLDILSGGFFDIDGGTVSLGRDLLLGGGVTGGRLDLDAGSLTVARNFSLFGNAAEGGDLRLNSGTLNVGGSFTLGAGATTDNATALLSGGTLAVAGNVDIANASLLTMNNAGSLLTLGADWINKGTFTANDGTVRFTAGSGNSAIKDASTFHHVECVKGANQLGLEASIALTGNWTFNSGALNLNALTADIDGNLLVSGASNMTATNSAAMLTLAGDFVCNAAFSHTVNGSIRFDGGLLAQTLTGSVIPSLFNVEIANASTLNLGMTLSLANDLLISDGTLESSLNDYTVDIGGDCALEANALFEANDSSILIDEDWTNNGGQFNRGNSTVTFDNDGANSILGGSSATTFHNLVLNDAGNSLTLDQNVNVANDLTISAGTLDTGADFALDIDGELLINGGTFTLNDSGIALGKSWTMSAGVLNAGTSTVTLDGATSPVSIGGVQNSVFFDLTIDKSDNAKTVALTNNSSVGGALVLNTGIFDVQTSLNAASHDLDQAGTEVRFTQNLAQNIPATTYNLLRVDKGANTATAAGNIIVNDDFILANGVWDANGHQLDLGGDFSNSASFTANGGTVRFVGANSPVLLGGANLTTFHTLIVAKSDNGKALTLSHDVNIDDDLTISSGSFSTGADFAMDIDGSLLVSGGLLILNDSEINVAKDWTVSSGSVNAGTSQVTFDGASNFAVIGGAVNTAFRDLVIDKDDNDKIVSITNNSSATASLILDHGILDAQSAALAAAVYDLDQADTEVRFTQNLAQSVPATTYAKLRIDKNGNAAMANGNIIVAGDFLLDAGTFDCLAVQLSVAGSFLNAGSFTAGTGTVVLNGSNQHISGSTIFNNLTKNVAMADMLTFENGSTQSILGVLDFRGSALDKKLSLLSDSLGEQWRIDAQSTRTLAFLSVQDSNNINATPMDARNTGSQDLGNNLNWLLAGITPNPAGSLVSTEAGGVVQFTVSLNTQPLGNVTIAVSCSDLTEGTVFPAALTFTTLDWSSPQTVTVTGVDDGVDDGNVAYEIILDSSSVADAVYNALSNLPVSVSNTDNDAALISINNFTVMEGNAGNAAAQFSVALSLPSVLDVSVDYQTADNSATTADNDYQSASGTLMIDAGDTSGTIIVQIQGDLTDELDETFHLNLSNAVNATLSDNQGIATIQDEDSSIITVNDISVIEGNASFQHAIFSVVLSTPSDRLITLDYATVNGNALQLSDYEASTGMLTFNPGDTLENVPVAVHGDTVDELDEDFQLNLSNSVNATIGDNQGICQIQDNDSSIITVDDVILTEGADGDLPNAVFTVSLSLSNDRVVTVGYATQDASATLAGNDYGGVSDTLTFNPGQTQKTVFVVIIGDSINEENEVFNLSLSNAVNANIGDATGVCHIQDDDPPGINLSQSGGATAVTEGGAGDNYSIVLLSQPLAAVLVTVTPSEQLDLGSGAGVAIQVNFTDSDWNLPQTINVSALNDAVDEGTHAGSIQHASASADNDYHDINIVDIAVQITDNDTAGFIVSPATGLITSELGATDQFTVVLTSKPNDGVIIQLSSSNEDEGLVSPASMTFSENDWDIPQIATISGQDDAVQDGNIAYEILLSLAESDDANYEGLDPEDVSVLNQDNDITAILVSDATVVENNAGTVTAQFTVSLNVTSTLDTSVDYATQDDGAVEGEDYTGVSGSLTIPAGQTSKIVQVLVKGDVVDELDETFFLNLSNPGNAILNDAQGVCDIQDNDTAGISIDNAFVTEGNAGTQTLTFTVSLSILSDRVITVDFTTFDNTATVADGDYVALNGTLTFNPGEFEKSIEVTVNGDNTSEPNQNFFLNLSNAANALIADDQGIGTIQNDDAPGFVVTESGGGSSVTEGGAADSYTIRILSQPTENVNVTLTPESQLDLGSGAGVAVQIVFTDLNWTEVQTVNVTAVENQIAEGAHVATVSHEVESNDLIYDGFEIITIEVHIEDNDGAGVTLTQVNGDTVVAEGGANDDFSLVLLSQPLNDVVITLTPDNQSSLGAGAGQNTQITFTDANWNQPQTIMVTAVDDDKAEGNHQSIVSFVFASDDSNYDAFFLASLLVSIADNDEAGFELSQTDDDTSVQEGGFGDTLEIFLKSQPEFEVQIQANPTNQINLGAGVGIPVALTFDAANWNVAKILTISALEDSVAEGSHSAQVEFSVTSQDSAYNEFEIPNVSVNIIDNDNPGLHLTQTDSSTRVFENGGPDSYSLVLNSEPNANVTVSVTPDARLDLGQGPGVALICLFGPDNWFIPIEISVLAIDDPEMQGKLDVQILHQTQSADPFYVIPDAGTLAVEIRDDEFYVNPGQNREDLPGLHGLSGSIQNSQLVDYDLQWLQLAGDPVVIKSANSLMAEFSAIVPGDYVFSLTAMGPSNLTDSGQITIRVLDSAPVAVLQPGFSVLRGEISMLSGGKSFDSNGTAIESYSWNLWGEENPVDMVEDILDDAADANPNFQADAAGAYRLSLVVSSGGQTSTEAVLEISVLDIEGAKVPPLADAGFDQTLQVNTQVMLNGYGSVDPDSGHKGDDLTYLWRQISGPAAPLNDMATETASFVPVEAGTYVFGLVVGDMLDDNLFSFEDSLQIIILDELNNHMPTAIPVLAGFDDVNSDGVINVFEGFQLSSAFSLDFDGHPLTAQWLQLSGPGLYQFAETANPYERRYMAFMEGSYRFQLIVNDGLVSSPPAEIEVQILSPNTSSPLALAKINGKEFLKSTAFGALVLELDAFLSIGDDGISSDGLSFSWRQIFGPTLNIANRESALATAEIWQGRAATYGFELQVTNAAGVSAKDRVWAEISNYHAVDSPGGNAIPTPRIKFPAKSLPGKTVVLNGSASFDPVDSDDVLDVNTGLRLYWVQVSGPIIAFDLSDPQNATFLPLSLGTYRFVCVAGDGNAFSAPVEIVLDVVEALSKTYYVDSHSEGCFIATAAYGSYAEKHVVLLRQFRDHCLMTHTPGRWFVRQYYRFSPSIAAIISDNGILKFVTRIFLIPLILLSWFLLKAGPLFKLLTLVLLLFARSRIIRKGRFSKVLAFSIK